MLTIFIGLLILQVLNQPKISIEIIVIISTVIFTVLANLLVPTGIDVTIVKIFVACVGMVEKWK
ncbi:hypothetical protein [Caldifermentibacillus hisashii]|uniref:hypothetical protein n=1 Tax=Caldifermentibacillus hisashii TaxID=996558 RepID=UPI001C10ABD6|nr:hypothetical protein [Caldifermentibacillus hisashii]MBU5343179.1 hypothetical protein [Caldifermentibacillus hisashii]